MIREREICHNSVFAGKDQKVQFGEREQHGDVGNRLLCLDVSSAISTQLTLTLIIILLYAIGCACARRLDTGCCQC